MSWLPYSHITARLVDHYLSILEGVTVCLSESANTVMQDIAEVQPTHMTSVPRLYEKVLTAVASVDPQVTKKRLKAAFGPRMEWLGSGGAPLALPVAEAYAAAGLLILQGYGLTESSPVISFNRKDSFKLGTVGQAIPGVEVKIAPDGEVLTRGAHVMKGYWNNPQATAEALQGGWLHTGDLGSIDADGFLSITGRKKEILVLSNGKKVVPTFIEGLLVSDNLIEQAAVYGEGRKFLSALIIPNWDNLRKNPPPGMNLDQPRADLVGTSGLHDFYERRVAHDLREVSPWEQVRKFILLPEPFSVAAEELTVSLKLRRQVVLEKYKHQLDALYRE